MLSSSSYKHTYTRFVFLSSDRRVSENPQESQQTLIIFLSIALSLYALYRSCADESHWRVCVTAAASAAIVAFRLSRYCSFAQHISSLCLIRNAYHNMFNSSTLTLYVIFYIILNACAHTSKREHVSVRPSLGV